MFKHKRLWIVLTSIFTVFFVAMIVGTAIAESYKSVIDAYFGVITYKVITAEETDISETEYFKSPYVLEGKTWTGQRAKNGEETRFLSQKAPK